jgi:hypothetical protein
MVFFIVKNIKFQPNPEGVIYNLNIIPSGFLHPKNMIFYNNVSHSVFKENYSHFLKSSKKLWSKTSWEYKALTLIPVIEKGFMCQSFVFKTAKPLH